MNLENLPPAPCYECFCKECCGGDNDEFIVLARNAFDVMMRRGWFVVPNYMTRPGTAWRVKTAWPNCEVEWKEWPDPFTALVEADKWFRENVDNKVIGK
jgi:hypothetical protein